MNDIQIYFINQSQKNYVNALNSFKKEFEKTPNSTKLMNKLAEFFFDTDNHSLARYYYDRSLKIDKNQPKILEKYNYIILNQYSTDEKSIDEAFKKFNPIK